MISIEREVAPAKAAQYVRMSTDEQVGSIGIQKEAIARYALTEGLEIVATYADAGKSGVTLHQRPAMQRLLLDVMSSPRDFDYILVLDISRWGRFQDPDESAYHEFHCRKHGVQVIYVAEPLLAVNGSLNSLLKQLRRVAAGDYSRDLGVKVRAGQERMLRNGGVPGQPCFGYQRQAVSQDGKTTQILNRGERRTRVTDTVRLVPGPPGDVALVQQIFRLYTSTDMTTWQVAQWLAENDPASAARLSLLMVRTILKRELYRGLFIWRKHKDRPLGISWNSAAERQPVYIEGFVAAIVEPATWWRAAEKLALGEPPRPARRKTAPGPDDVLLSELRDAVSRNPGMTSDDFRSEGLRSRSVYVNRFGTVSAAYKMVGRRTVPTKGAWRTNRLEGIRALAQLLDDIARIVVSAGIQCVKDQRCRTIMLLPQEVIVHVKVAHLIRGGKRERWRFDGKSWGDSWLLLMRSERPGNGRDFYLLPPMLRGTLGSVVRSVVFDGLGDYRLVEPTEIVHRMRSIAHN